MSIKLKLMLALTGAFLLLAPISVSTSLAFAEAAKYARLVASVLIVALGLGSFFQLGRASSALLAFVGLFVLSGVWSDSPLMAVVNKLMFACSCVSGILLACSLRTAPEMRSAIRFLGLVAAAAAVVALLVFLLDPNSVKTQNRFAVFGINPNMLGHTSVPLAILCMHVALTDRRRLWRVLMIGACCVFGLIIIATGCRGAALTMTVGTVCLVAPYTRRPGVVMGIMLAASLVAFVGFEVLDIGGNDRLISEIGKNTRAGVWKWALRNFEKSPLIGVGWMHFGSHSSTVQSMYLQVLAETGILGSVMLLATLAIVASGWLTVFMQLQRLRFSKSVCYLALALIMVELAHGLTESSPVVGASLASLALGLGVGLVDRAVRLVESSRPVMPLNTPASEALSVRRRPSAREVLEGLGQNRQRLPSQPTP